MLAEIEIAQAATVGDIQKIKAILAADYIENFRFDANDRTALFYAVMHDQSEAVKCLLDHGANAEHKDTSGKTAMDYANPKLYEYMQKRLEQDKKEVTALANAFETIFKNEYAIAKKNKKKILVILGERHHIHKITLLKNAMENIVKSLGVHTLFLEFPKILKCGDDSLLSTEAIDNHPHRDEGAGTQERNVVMAQEINKAPKDALLLTGTLHLRGFLELASSKIDTHKYHVVPFNLGKLSPMYDADPWVDNPNNVIQVAGSSFTNAEPVRAHWNQPHYAKAITIGSLIFSTGCLWGMKAGFFAFAGLSGILAAFFSCEAVAFFGLKPYQQYCHQSLPELTQKPKEQLNAFKDGANPNLTMVKSCLMMRDWWYMKDYYAGRIAQQEKEKALIQRVTNAHISQSYSV